MPEVRDHHVTSGDGRVLAVQEGGDLGGRPIVVHHGSPGSRLLFAEHVALAERQGARLISYDRPGYGGSTRQPGRSVADCAEDVRAIAAALGLERIAVWGVSGGGPHALACAALLPQLVVAVASLAGVAPWGAEGLDFYDGMGELNVEDTKLYHSDREAARAKCARDREEVLAGDPAQFEQLLESLLSPVDAAVLTGAYAAFLLASMREGLAPGADGWWDDAVAHMEPWGFELDSIRTPVLLRQGREDRFVPFGHGEWLARQVPGVQAELTDDDGHLTQTERHLESVHAWLLERLG